MMPDYPSPATWTHASPRQAQRAARSFAILKQREVPVFPGPLFVADEQQVHLQDPADVARRVLILWALDQRAEGMPRAEAVELVDALSLWPAVTPSEKAFLMARQPDPEECRQRVWQLESIWVLLWALRYVQDLEWPGGMCDVEALVGIVMPREADPTFITEAALRPVNELLDAQDLTMRIHWAIRDAWLNHGGLIPRELDWSADGKMVHVNMSPAVAVVEHRHHALNWLVKFLDPQDWDHVETHS